MLLLDLHAFGGHYHPRVSTDFAEASPSALHQLDADRDRYRVTALDRKVDTSLDTEMASASLGLIWDLQDVIITSPLLVVRNEAVLGLVGLDLGVDSGRTKVDALLAHLPLASFLGVRYLLTTHRIEDSRLLPQRLGTVKLYRNLTVQPLATVVGCVRQAEDPEDAWERLQDLRPGYEAVVEVDAGESLLPDLTACSNPGRPGSVEILEHHGDRWRLLAKVDAPALLTLAETDYPGWRASVDGAPAPIHTTNLAFRGVQLEPGEHEIVFEYHPAWLRPTAIAAFMALLLGLAVLVWPRRRSTAV